MPLATWRAFPRDRWGGGFVIGGSLPAALAMLGLGRERVKRVPVDGQGRMRPDELAGVLADCHGPTIVCAQAGNVNTGAFDPLAEIAARTARTRRLAARRWGVWALGRGQP